MLTQARVLGHVFNPLTVYWCHRPDGTPLCVVAEVHNTYGERHCYLLHPDEAGRAATRKDFYVSPFFPVDGGYRMRLPQPGPRLDLTVHLERQGARPFTATVRGTRRPGTPAQLLRLFLRHPFSTVVVSAAIRLHGIRLFLRLPPYSHVPVIAPRKACSEGAHLPRPLPFRHRGPRRDRHPGPDRARERPRVSVDPGRWPDVAALPRASRARTALAERLVRRALARLPLRARIMRPRQHRPGRPAHGDP